MKVALVGFEGRDRLLKGANFISDAVKKTIGPSGQNFSIEKGLRITNDGITVARELIDSIEDEIERQGARILLEAITRANDVAGDGSSTATVLTQAIAKESVRKLPSKDRLKGIYTPSELLKKIEAERVEVTKKLQELSTEVTTEQELINIATVSVEDDELGELIGKTQWELGKEGVIIAEEVNEKVCSIERVQGLLLDNGFGSQAVINNPEKEALELNDVRVIYTNHTITISDFSEQQDGSASALVDVITFLAKMGHKNIVIMARAFTQDAIQHCLKQMESGIGIFPLNAPYTDQGEVMQDLQAVLGGRFINADTDSLTSLQLSDVGFASHVIAKRMTTIFTGKGDTKERVENLQKKREGTGSDFEKRNLDTRIAQLTNGFAVLKVGATSETERKYKKDKADDAVNAVRSAFQEGYVPGGGQALKTISDTLPDDYILKIPLLAPYLEIRTNAGDDLEIPETVIDSTKVTRIALEKACSVAGVLSTAAGAVTTKVEKKCCHDR